MLCAASAWFVGSGHARLKHDSVLPCGVLPLGSHGPWLVDRIAAVGHLGSDQSSDAKRRLLREAVAKNCFDDAAFQHCRSIMRFFASDAAPDETQAGLQSYKLDFPNMKFLSTDPSHGSMVALKTAFQADEEVCTVDRLMVTGKNPASLSKLVRTSAKLQEVLKDAQVEECVSILQHFGFAPQRFDAKKVPMGRIATRLRESFQAIAFEAENGEPKRRNAAENLLNELTGDKSMRLVLAGMMADLVHEHSKHVHAGDEAFVDPIKLEKAEQLFLARLQVLFHDGLVLTAKQTFTGQVLKFLSDPKVLFFKKKALVLSLGSLDRDDELFQPLNRMRLICRAIHQMLQATRPSFSWGRRFLCFALPSDLKIAHRNPARDLAESQLFCYSKFCLTAFFAFCT